VPHLPLPQEQQSQDGGPGKEAPAANGAPATFANLANGAVSNGAGAYAARGKVDSPHSQVDTSSPSTQAETSPSQRGTELLLTEQTRWGILSQEEAGQAKVPKDRGVHGAHPDAPRISRSSYQQWRSRWLLDKVALISWFFLLVPWPGQCPSVYLVVAPVRRACGVVWQAAGGGSYGGHAGGGSLPGSAAGPAAGARAGPGPGTRARGRAAAGDPGAGGPPGTAQDGEAMPPCKQALGQAGALGQSISPRQEQCPAQV
jgi:hypothetical protein